MSHSNIYIEDYTSKSFVVRGETRDYKDALKSLGGKWNSRLTDKSTGDKFGAWLFWADKRDELEKWLSEGCSVTSANNSYKTTGMTGTSSTSTATHAKTTAVADSNVLAILQRLEAKIDTLTKLLNKSSKPEEVVEDDAENEEEIGMEIVPPRRRLLGGK
jgi:hypothetical protein